MFLVRELEARRGTHAAFILTVVVSALLPHLTVRTFSGSAGGLLLPIDIYSFYSHGSCGSLRGLPEPFTTAR